MYHAHKVHLSEDQFRKIKTGKRVRLVHKALHGEHTLYLTKRQKAHLEKAHKDGTGAEILLSEAQLRHHRKVGGSLWDTVKSGLKSGVKLGLDKGLDKAAELASAKLKTKGTAGQLAATAVDMAKPAIKDLLQGFVNRFGGALRKKMHAHLKGHGFFDDVLGGVSSALSHPLGQIAMNTALRRLGGSFHLGGGVQQYHMLLSAVKHHHGAGMAKKLHHALIGSGFFDDILSGVGQVLSHPLTQTVATHALPLLL